MGWFVKGITIVISMNVGFNYVYMKKLNTTSDCDFAPTSVTPTVTESRPLICATYLTEWLLFLVFS